MAGICGVVSKENCVEDLFLQTFYLQHRAQAYCGLALYNGEELRDYTREGLIKQQFPKVRRRRLKGNSGIGVVSSDEQPVSGLSRAGGIILGFDGNVINYQELKEMLLSQGKSFDGHYNPEKVNDTVIISKIISAETSFDKGIERLVDEIQGDFAIVALAKQGVYVARGWGRKPLILGRKDGSYAVSSESNSFVNTGFEIVRDVEPGEIGLLDGEGMHTLKKLNLSPLKYGTFEWIYTAHPASVIDGRSVVAVRLNIGKALARRYPVKADIVSGIPNSGRWHGKGYARESGIPYEEVFIRYDYSDRSYTPLEQTARDEEAKTKLIPIPHVINGNKIILVDDSIVRGTQTLNQVERLRDYKAIKVHARIACHPLMAACKYGKTTKKDEDCIARRMPVGEIKERLRLDSLEYATVNDLEEAIGLPREKLCLECWAS